MFTTTKTFGHDLGLSCCFRQWRAEHSHCRFLHGYAIAVTLVVGCETLDQRNWCFDFGGFKKVKELLVNTFDHRLIVAQDDPWKDEILQFSGLGFADCLVLPNVGCEAFARYIYDNVAKIVHDTTSGRVKLMEVTVREHGANAASYSPTSSTNHV